MPAASAVLGHTDIFSGAPGVPQEIFLHRRAMIPELTADGSVGGQSSRGGELQSPLVDEGARTLG